MKDWLAITWAVSNRFGWGVYGLNLVLELLRRGRPTPICLENISTGDMTEETKQTLRPVIEFHENNIAKMYREGKVANLKNAVVLHAMGNGLEWSLVSEAFVGDANVGVIFFEYTEFPPRSSERASRLDMIVAGSSWNAEVLAAQNLTEIRTVLQGVDTDLFRPRARTGRFGDKFVVFSGGKLDFRKGQDIVLAAFREFQQRHNDAVLVTAWHNLWPLTATGFMDSPYATGLPNVGVDNRLKIAEWAAKNGIKPDRFVDLGLIPNEQTPDFLRDVDLAVFPNRCEGGTNLVAMETMACGVPCVLSKNTGHLDLIGDERCYALERQQPVTIPGHGTDGWGESDVEELVEAMEQAYQDRTSARNKGQAGAEFMRGLNWPDQIGKLLDAVEEVS